MAGTTLAIADTTNVTKFGTWSTNAGLSGNQYFSQAGDTSAYVQFRMTGLTAATAYSIAMRWKLNTTAFYTAVRVVLLDSDGTTVLKTTYINQRYAPDAETISTLPYRWIFNVVPTGTTAYVRVYGDNNASSDFVVAEAIYWQPWTDGLLSTPASLADGNWADQNIWAGGVVPTTSHDSVRVYNTVNVAANASVGTSGASGTNSIICKRDSGSLVVNDGVTLTVKGGIQLAQLQNVAGRTAGYYPLQVGQGITGGAVLEFDASASSGAASVYTVVQAASGQPNAITRILGTSGNHAIVRSNAGGANAYFSDGGFPGRAGQVYADYCDFLRMGDSTHPAIKALLTGTSDTLRLVGCTFTTCSKDTVTYTTSNSGTVVTITDCKFYRPVLAVGLPRALVGAGSGTSTRTIQRNSFYGMMDLNHTSAFAGTDLRNNNYFLPITYNNATSSPDVDKGHIFYRPEEVDDAILTTFGGLNGADCYVLGHYPSGTRGNPHSFQGGGTAAITVTRFIWDYIGATIADVGDAWDNGNNAVTINYGLVLPSSVPSGTRAAAGAFWMFSTGTGSLTLNHCTVFCSNADISGIQTGHNVTPGTAGRVPRIADNLFWTDQSSIAFLACDNPSTIAQDFVTPTGILNNNLSGNFVPFATNKVGASTGVSILGMNGLNFSVAPVAQTTLSPGFVDPTRNFLSWARNVKGLSGTDTAVVASALALMEADPTLTELSLIPYIRDGFKITNASLSTAATDGTYVGAVPYQAATGGFIPVRFDGGFQLMTGGYAS